MYESVEEMFRRSLIYAATVAAGADPDQVAVVRAAFFAGFRAGFSSPAATKADSLRLEDELDEFERTLMGE